MRQITPNIIEINQKTVNKIIEKNRKKLTYGGIEQERYNNKVWALREIAHYINFENDAVDLQLNNLILTYGAGKIIKAVTELTKLKKVG